MKSLFAALVAVLVLALGATASASTFRTADITARDGVVLKANMYVPDGAGPFPAIVFPSSWGLNNLEYLAQAKQFADQGYVALSYTPRGWYDSGGQIETAGPKDQADVSDVISWTLANTPADPARVGMAGISYGAGLSLLGAALDPRVKAVGAMSAWTDLSYSLYANQTRHGQAAALLKIAGDLLGDPSPGLNDALSNYFDNTNLQSVVDYARPRGVATYLSQINANQPAVLIANAFGDSLFAPNQLVDFYNQYTGPKRLELRPGDHATAELSGILGVPNDAWTSVHRWMDRYLKGVANGIDTEKPIQLQPFGTSTYEGYSSWSAVSTSSQSFGLTGWSFWTNRGDLRQGSTSTGWGWTINGGISTPADGGIALLSNGLAALTGSPPTVWHPAIDRSAAGVWITPDPAFSSPRRIRGAPHLHVTVTPSVSNSTVVAYLYDADWAGNGKLITNVPYTIRGGTAGSPVTIDTDFPDVAYDVPSGDWLMLVIDTVDPLYLDQAPLFSTVKFSSPSGNASYVRIPLK